MESQSVRVISKPEGARVHVDGTFMGDTNITLSLSHPVFRSERSRYKYKHDNPGIVSSFIGARSSKSVISSRKEERSKPASRTYLIEVRKEGYSLAKRRISVPGTRRIGFVLKKKPGLLVRKFKVKNNVRLSFFEKLYELLYGNRFSVRTAKLGGIERRFFTSRKVRDVFKTTTSKKADYELKGEVIIAREFIEIRAAITDKSGVQVTQGKTCLQIKKVEGLLGRETERLISSIIDGFLKENY